MPMDYSRYPKDWKAISRRIREAAGQRCQWCGVKNGAVGARDRGGTWHDEDDIHHMNSDYGFALFGGDFPKIIRVVLTVAHLDHDTQNNADANLVALCQKCHLTYDRKHHQENAAKTRRRKALVRELTKGQRALPGVIG